MQNRQPQARLANKKMKVNCQQHRKTMELLGLRLQLEERALDPKARDEIKARITELERDLEMD